MDVIRGYARLAWERRPDGLTLAIALAALVGAGIALARQATYGALLNLDSLNYLATARNLLDGQIFIDHAGDAYAMWPPLYPLTMAVASLGIADPLAIAGPLGVGIFALTIFVVGRYLRRLASGYMVAWACFALALSIPMIDATATAWSEPLFILMAALALIRADDYLASGKRSALLWTALFSALAWQTRYIGVAVPVVIGLALLLQAGAPLRDRLRRGAVYGLIVGLPMAAWLARNYLMTGSLTAHQPPVDYSLLGLAAEALGGLWIWAHYDNADWVQVEWLAFLPAASAALLIGMLAAIGVGSVLARRFGGARLSGSARRALWLFSGFALAYAAIFFALMATGRPHHGVFFRFLTPLYLPLVVVVAVAADGLLAFLREGGMRDGATARRWRAARRLAGVALIAGMTLWLVGQAVPNARAVAYANSDEFQGGYTTHPWLNSPTLRFVDEYPMDGIVYGNRPEVVYLRNTGEALHIPLNLYRYEGGHVARLADWLVEAEDGAWLVWFKRRGDGVYLPDAYLPQMRVMARLRPVAEFVDGAIFRVDRDYRPDAGDNPFLAAYERIAAGELAAAAYSDFSVYWDGDRVIYMREPCSPQDIDARFMLHIFPEDAADLPAARSAHGFVNADFTFAAHGALFDGKCVAIAPLPDYAVERIRTGQYVLGGGPELWSVDVRQDASLRLGEYADTYYAYLDAYRAAIAGEYGEPVAGSEFAVYRAGDTLVYLKEPCEPANVEVRFFLHTFPVYLADLPAERLERGFENLDFWFAHKGADLGGRCVAIARLPGYEMERIRTGQFVGGVGNLWRVDFKGR